MTLQNKTTKKKWQCTRMSYPLHSKTMVNTLQNQTITKTLFKRRRGAIAAPTLVSGQPFILSRVWEACGAMLEYSGRVDWEVSHNLRSIFRDNLIYSSVQLVRESDESLPGGRRADGRRPRLTSVCLHPIYKTPTTTRALPSRDRCPAARWRPDRKTIVKIYLGTSNWCRS